MNLDPIRELIRLMRENQIAEVDLEEEGRKIRIVAAAPPSAVPSVPAVLAAPVLPAAPLPPAVSAPPAAPEPPVETGPRTVPITSPLVGTFYRSPSPESPAYVNEGDEVEEETVVCIVEAMKVMNEIKAEVRGRLAAVLVENQQPVEFGQPLFRVIPPGAQP